jgi:hypothetical protein
MYLPERYGKAGSYIMDNEFENLSYTVYECKYHIVFYPRYRFTIVKSKEKILGGIHGGSCVITVGFNEEGMRKYVRWQDKEEKGTEQRQRGLFN